MRGRRSGHGDDRGAPELGIAASESVKRARVAVTAVFALNGFLFGTVFSRLPALRERADVSDGQLGLILLCAMAGTLVMQPLSGALTPRYGSRRLVVAGALGYSLGLVVVAAAAPGVALAGAFLLLGVVAGLLDVTMNVQGVAVEGLLGRPILASLHAAFSFGALAGALGGSAAVAADLGIRGHLLPAALLGLVVVAVAAPALVRHPAGEPGAPAWARPTRALATLGALAFCVLLSEGALNDWVAVYFTDEIDVGGSVAAGALAAFSLAMATGRLAGDRVTAAVGPRRLARAGAMLAAAGMAVALAAGGPAPALAGVVATGLGLAAIFPLTLRAAAASGAAGPAIATVSGIGYTAFLLGPPLIGGLSDLTSLRAALLIVVALCAVAAALARSLGFEQP